MKPLVCERSRRIILGLHARYHSPEYIAPDPLEFVYRYPAGTGDRELAAFVASAFALGRVGQILQVLQRVFLPFPELRAGLLATDEAALEKLYAGFVYRFFRTAEIVALFAGLRRILLDYGSLNAAFLWAAKSRGGRTREALEPFAALVREACGDKQGILVPDPGRGGACKRLRLFLRWMVRRDAVDPGEWEGVGTASLVVPLDTHLMRVGARLGLHARRSADGKTADAVTRALAELDPDDPVKFDFSLTRPGIRPDLDYDGCIGEFGEPKTDVRSA